MILFVVLSGIGKLIYVRMWKYLFKDDVLWVNDDKLLFDVISEGIFVYGVLFSG